jgi:hypothetical protein
MSLRRELIDELLKDYPKPQDVLAKDGLLKQLTKAVIERCRCTRPSLRYSRVSHRSPMCFTNESVQPDLRLRADRVCRFGMMIGGILPSSCSRMRSL